MSESLNPNMAPEMSQGQPAPQQAPAQAPQQAPELEEDFLVEDFEPQFPEDLNDLVDDKGNLKIQPMQPQQAPKAAPLAPEVQVLMEQNRQLQQMFVGFMQNFAQRGPAPVQAQQPQGQDPFAFLDPQGQPQAQAQDPTQMFKAEVDRIRAEADQRIAALEQKLEAKHRAEKDAQLAQSLVNEADAALTEFKAWFNGNDWGVDRGQILATMHQYGGIDARKAARIVANKIHENIKRGGFRQVRKAPQQAPGILGNQSGAQLPNLPQITLTGDSDTDWANFRAQLAQSEG